MTALYFGNVGIIKALQQVLYLQEKYYKVVALYAERNTMTPNHIFLPCGGTAYFDHGSGISYRCETCFAVVGSIGQSQRCADEAQKWRNVEALGGKGWDYKTGKQLA